MSGGDRPIALGLDVGTKTIGVARTDGLGWMAHPVVTVARKGVQKDVDALMPLLAEHGATLIVVGLPFELDGTEERSARLARQAGPTRVKRHGQVYLWQGARFAAWSARSTAASSTGSGR